METLDGLCKGAISVLGNAGGRAQDIIRQASATLESRGYNVVRPGGKRADSGVFWTDIARHNGWKIQQNDAFKQHRILGPDSRCHASIKDPEKLWLFLKTITEIGGAIEREERAKIERVREQERQRAEAENARLREAERRREEERKAKEAEERRRRVEKERQKLEEENNRKPAACWGCGTAFSGDTDRFCGKCGTERQGQENNPRAMACGNCGKPFGNDDANFCPGCGEKR
ncbi:MAG: zinc ribbon domain-containing protein [Treponema sp.]|nr:zinc ribbon domain-containing protein [Treponema sp.]